MIVLEVLTLICHNYVVLTYTFSVHAALFGLSNLFPSSKYLMSVNGSTPGYGLRPRLNTSQHVTPNDHCMHRIIAQIMNLWCYSCIIVLYI